MNKRIFIAIAGLLILVGFYVYYQDQQKSQTTVDCLIEPNKTVINIYEGDQLIRSTGFSETEILDWYKGRYEPAKIKQSRSVKEFKSVNPEQGIMTFQQGRPNYFYSELISRECFDAIPANIIN